MVKRERKFYSEEFKERVLAAYQNSSESVSQTADRYQVNRDTVGSWVYRRRTGSDSKKKAKLAPSETDIMKRETLSPEAKEARIREPEEALAGEKMRSECPEKMIETAERELKIDIRKNRCQTVHEMRQKTSSYGTDVLCRLSGRSRQAYYERSRYAAAAGVEEDTILSPVREVRKDFPQMGAGKLPVYLKPELEGCICKPVVTPLLICCTGTSFRCEK